MWPSATQNIEPAIVVVVEKETAEAERDQAGAADLRTRGFIDKQAVAFVVVEREHLVGEIGDDDAGVARAVVVGGIHAHAGAGDAVFAECDAGRDARSSNVPLCLLR